MAQIEQVEGIVLSVRDHRESDRLVKIFTATEGKRMFFAAGTRKPRSRLAPAILSFTKATFIADMKPEGLCFLRDAKEIYHYTDIQKDIFLNAYATYILNLADAALEDGVADYGLYHKIEMSLQDIDEGYDPAVITHIYEMQLLPYFGVSPSLMGCAICGETEGHFDYSIRYNGILCQKHWDMDLYRMRGLPKTIYLLRLFSRVNLDQLGQVQVSDGTKKDLKRIIDTIYEDSVGIHLKSKSFIDQMYDWGSLLQDDKEKD